LMLLCGLLDPQHSGSATASDKIVETLERRSATRTVVPTQADWLYASVLCGTLARLRQYGATDRKRVFNDALVFASARNNGFAVLTRNISDFDLLQQLDPSGKVLFYERTL
ncbi:MAG TPA: hypothetical protein VGC88_08725, partial [Terriglobales bacterium]